MGVDFQTESTSASFTFSSPDSGVTFECALDEGAMLPCQSPKSYTGLQSGAHDFAVQAVDAAGNVDPTPAEYGWEIGDLTPPVVTIHTGPTAVSGAEETTNDQTATFTFSVDDAAAVLQCSLDGGEFRVCSSPKTYTAEQLAAASGIVDGPHTFELQAVKHDLLVEADAPALWEWTIVDIAPPDTTIQTTVPAELQEGVPLLLTFTSDDPTANFECSLDGADFGGCASAPPGNTYELDAPAGPHTLAVRAVDLAATPNVDPTPVTVSWLVVGEPLVTFDAAPTDPTTDTFANFEFSADVSPVTYTCSLNDAPPTSCASPLSYTEDNLIAAQVAAGDPEPTVYTRSHPRRRRDEPVRRRRPGRHARVDGRAAARHRGARRPRLRAGRRDPEHDRVVRPHRHGQPDRCPRI